MLALQARLRARSLRIILAVALLVGAAASLTPSAFSTDSTPSPALDTQTGSPVSPGEFLRPVAGLEGWVVSEQSGAPVRGAKIYLSGREVVTSDSEGYFAIDADQTMLNSMEGPEGTRLVELSVAADGYGTWSISRAVYFPSDTLRVYPKLAAGGTMATRHEAALADLLGREDATRELSALDLAEGAPQGFSTNALAALTPPATIRVYRTARGVVEVVPFRDYVKHSLPSEWIPTWGAESLKAGAMAVKSYAWFWVSRGGKQSHLGADVKDNVDDQVYDPNVSYASTDAAVDATFNYALSMNGRLFQTQYCAGSYGPDPSGDCPWPGPYMTQWGSSYYADQGRSWSWILQFYYRGAIVSPEPPGGGYTGGGGPPRPQPTATPIVFSVGQGATRPGVFREAYERNGGVEVLGKPTGAVRWWLGYESPQNLLAQPFSGPNGRGNVWLVYDAIRSTDETGHRAFMIAGAIASAYANHVPPGPEWIGAPTSDPYVGTVDVGALASQGFSRGTLVVNGSVVELRAWPEQFSGWKAEYFSGRHQQAQTAPIPYSLPGRPVLIREQASPGFKWDRSLGLPQQHGVGAGEWSLQLTREAVLEAGSYDLRLTGLGGARLWVNELLAANNWNAPGPIQAAYNVDLPAGSHRIRIQYYSTDSAADLNFTISKRAAPEAIFGAALRAQVQWLGRPQRPHERLVQPVTLTLRAPGQSAAVGVFKGTTDANGMAVFRGLPAGTFDLRLKGPHSLQTLKSNVSLAIGSTAEVDFKAQVEGDVNGDNCVNVDDFSIVQESLGSYTGIKGHNPAADLNGDGEVAMADVSLLRSGFDMCGDISADAEFRAMSVGAPALSARISPWLNAGSMRRDARLYLVPTASSIRPGQVVEFQVVAATGAQSVDGASFIVHFDPKQLVPVDQAGRPSTGVEPGVALPAVMGTWVDLVNGSIGYSGGLLQGEPPSGMVVVAKLRFLVSRGATGTLNLGFAPVPSPHMQVTNGGVNLLARSDGLRLQVSK